MSSIRQHLNHWFELDTRKTSIQTELLAGLTTFVAMSYIVIVMPQMWGTAGMDFQTGYLATIIAMAIGTSVMGIAANYPIAIAPGIGINAYLIYTVAASGVSWQETIGISVAAAAIFTVLSLTSFRRIFIESIPESLKIAIGVGIGFFISFIGLQNGHLIIGHPSTLVSLGTFADPVATLTIMGLLLAIVLMVLRVPGSIFLSMAGVAATAYLLGFLSLPDSWFSMPPDLNAGFWQFRLDHIVHYGMEVFVVLLLTLFDTTGTLLGVGRQAGIIRDGHFPHLQSSLLADSIGSFVGGLFSSGPTSSYSESGTGVAVGGRTGLANVFTVLFFILLLFCLPIASTIASMPAITAPALILVGALMCESLLDIHWRDITESFPAFFTILLMPLTYSIALGVGAGFILYTLIKVCTGNYRKVHPFLYLMAVLFAIQIIFCNS